MPRRRWSNHWSQAAPRARREQRNEQRGRSSFARAVQPRPGSVYVNILMNQTAGFPAVLSRARLTRLENPGKSGRLDPVETEDSLGVSRGRGPQSGSQVCPCSEKPESPVPPGTTEPVKVQSSGRIDNAGIGESLEVETASLPSAPHTSEHRRKRLMHWPAIAEGAVFLTFAVFFLAYGLTPLLGGDGLGLVGADEPRYAQIAHEMLVRFDSAPTIKSRLTACVTPYLYGRPWLEKPALYYWRAMFVFQDFGVHDWAARLPSTSFAFVMTVLIYLHMRRFRPGGHLDAALITAASAGIIGFAR